MSLQRTSPVSVEDPDRPWHVVDADVAVDRLGVDPAVGLDREEVERRRAEHGPNVLQERQKRAPWLAFLDQFKNFLILILLAAAVVSFLVSGDLTTPIVILVVVMLNAVLGFVQENRAERSLEALRTMLVVRSKVLRGGEIVEVDTRELVPGDIVLVEAGDRVPADGRLLESASLEVEEAALTGESAPVAKLDDAVVAEDAPLGDRHGVVFMNTVVTRGRGRFVVTSTGMGTEMGRIAGMLGSTTDEPTPLQRQLDHVAHVLAGLAAVIVAIVFVVGLIRGESFSDLFLTAVALAVASVPEGLPAVLAVTLAIGAHRMARRNAVIKRLASVETLGCTSVICSDKTGTLTLNEMTARRVVLGGQQLARHRRRRRCTTGELVPDSGPDGPGAKELEGVMEAMALCNDSVVRDGEVIGDPTEVALVVLAAKAGVSADEVRARRPRRWEVPFESATKFMATAHDADDPDAARQRLYVKGAVDVLLDRCSTWLDESGRRAPLDADARQRLLERNDEMAAEGMRVLALAWRDLDRSDADPSDDAARAALVDDLQMIALVGIVDPPRPEAARAIAECRGRRAFR